MKLYYAQCFLLGIIVGWMENESYWSTGSSHNRWETNLMSFWGIRLLVLDYKIFTTKLICELFKKRN